LFPRFFIFFFSLLDSSQETDKIKQLTVGPLLAQCISNIHNRKSISALFK